MARFVSPHLNYFHGVRSYVPAHLGPDGVMMPEQRELGAAFGPDGRTDKDVSLAKQTFSFRGMPIHENGQPLDPFYRVSVWDSGLAQLQEGWTDEETDLVVEALRTNGPIGHMYVEVVPVATEKPWNGYDDLTDADQILELALAIKADLEQVAQYERENKDRQDVLDAVAQAQADASETIIVSA